MSTKTPIQPELLYEDTSAGSGNPFPFIETLPTSKMPTALWIFEYKHTGEFEPGSKGEEIPIVDQIPHTYIDLAVLKEKLRPELFDEVRVCLGMLPLKEAEKLGQEKLEKAKQNVEQLKKEKQQSKN